MNFSFREAYGLLGQSGYQKVDELINLANSVSGKVLSATSDSTFLLHSGFMEDGTKTSALAAALQKSGQAITVGLSEAGEFLHNLSFQQALLQAVASEVLNGAPVSSATPEQRNQINSRVNEIYFGFDNAGNRINSTSLWDKASERFVSENDGHWRIIAGENIDPNSVLVKTEIPALLGKSTDFTIDGIQKSLIVNSGNVQEQIAHVPVSVKLCVA